MTTRWQALPGRMVALGSRWILRHTSGAARRGFLGASGIAWARGRQRRSPPAPASCLPAAGPGPMGVPSAAGRSSPPGHPAATGWARAAIDGSAAAGCARFGSAASSASERHASAAVVATNDAPRNGLSRVLPTPAPWPTSPIVFPDPCPGARQRPSRRATARRSFSLTGFSGPSGWRAVRTACAPQRPFSGRAAHGCHHCP